MKRKTKEFVQHLGHDIEVPEAAKEYLDDSLPLVGEVVMHFNGLEKSLDSLLCENFTERTDSVGLIVLHGMPYSAKVDLFKRFADDFQSAGGGCIPGYAELMKELSEVGRLRNLVIHADWENTDEEGYTYIRLKLSSKGMEQEYIQFTNESLHNLIMRIFATRDALYEFWEKRAEILNRTYR